VARVLTQPALALIVFVRAPGIAMIYLRLGPPGAVEQLQRSPYEICFVWCFCICGQGA
jgi:hypothetical protein